MDFSVSSVKPIESAPLALDEIAPGIEAEPSTGPDATPAAGAGSSTPHADTATALVRGGFVERVLGETQNTVAALPAPAPGERFDRNVETVNIQTFMRAPVPQAEQQAKPLDTMATGVHHGHVDLAVPAAQLTPAALIGLQVEHATIWPMTARGFDPDLRPVHEARVAERETHDSYDDDEYDAGEDGEDETTSPQANSDDAASEGEVVDGEDQAWCAALTRLIRSALAAKAPPPALLTADEQWRRGRCVVLACPQRADPDAGAWAFVLWPRKHAGEHGERQLDLVGTRVEARLQWSSPPAGPRWLGVRVIKQHHARTGRQLVPATPDAPGRVPCEVQLGPVLARALRPCEVCLKIGNARRFWLALGAQWSMHVVVSALPLLDERKVAEEVSR